MFRRRAAIVACLFVVGLPECAYTQWPDGPETWVICSIVDNRPLAEPVEIPLGGSGTFGIATNMLRVGTHEPFPVRQRLPAIHWSIEPAARGVDITQTGAVTV